MDKIFQALGLELEATYHTRPKLMTLVLVLAFVGMISPAFNTSGEQGIFDENTLNYKITVEREFGDSDQQFLATNNEIEQIHQEFFVSDPTSIGAAVAVANENLIAVSNEDEDGLLTVHILEKSNGTWQETYTFSYEASSRTNYEIPSSEVPADAGDLLFGSSLAFDGNNLLAIGATGWQGPTVDDDTSTTDVYEVDDGTDRGAVYIFQRNGNTWSLASTIRGTGSKGRFGSAVSFSPSGILAIGAKSSATYDSCPRYLTNDTYTVPANEDTDNDNDVDEDDTTTTSYISVACPSVHLFKRDSNQGVSQWDELETIEGSATQALFGASVAFASDELLAVGAPRQLAPNVVNGEGYTRRPGAVHLYAKDTNGDWGRELVISDFNTTTPAAGEYQVELEDLDYFGTAVGFVDSTTLVASIEHQGVLLVVEKSGGSWNKTAEIKGHELLTGVPLRGSENDRADGFGTAIGTDGVLLAVTQDGATGSINLLGWNSFRPGDDLALRLHRR